jgi:hypothetical protein
VTIDGKKYDGLKPGGTRRFEMDWRCSHSVTGISEDDKAKWSSNIQCQGRPYANYTLNWTGNNRPPVENELEESSFITSKREGDYSGQLSITSKMDCVAIEKLSANRGNCQLNASIPAILKFGQTLTLYYACGRLLELNIGTDQGHAEYSWTD